MSYQQYFKEFQQQNLSEDLSDYEKMFLGSETYDEATGKNIIDDEDISDEEGDENIFEKTEEEGVKEPKMKWSEMAEDEIISEEEEKRKFYDKLKMVEFDKKLLINKIENIFDNVYIIYVGEEAFKTPQKLWEQLSKTKIPIFLTFDTKDIEVYVDINKNRLREIVKKEGKFKDNFYELIEWFFGLTQGKEKKVYTDEIMKMIKDGKDDETVYKRIVEIMINYESKLDVRAHKKYGQVMEMLPDFVVDKDFVYLDVGCKDGTLANEMIKQLKLKKDQVFGVEVEIPNYVKKEFLEDSFNFYLYPEYSGAKLPERMIKQLNGRKISLVTAMAVLHHVKPIELPSLLKNIYDNMADDSYFVIREHDVQNKKLIPVIDVEHVIYSTIGKNPERTLEKFLKENPTHTGDFKSSQEWDRIMADVGFKRVQMLTTDLDVTKKFKSWMYLAVFRRDK